MISKLIEQCRVTKGGTSYFDWRGLGIQAGVCFNAVPSQINFLNGPLVDGNEEVQVRQRARRNPATKNDSDNEEERPEDVKGHTARGADQLSAVQTNIEDVMSSLKRKVQRTYASKRKNIAQKYGGKEKIPERVSKRMKKHNDVCAIQLLFNPKSFTQTVENLYHYSFLVKTSEASLKVRSNKVLDKEKGIKLDGGPVVKPIIKNDNSKYQKNDTPKPRQAIVSLTMESWRDLVEAYKVESSDVPHRGS